MDDAKLAQLRARRGQLKKLLAQADKGFDFQDFDEHGRPIEVTKERVAQWRQELAAVEEALAVSNE